MQQPLNLMKHAQDLTGQKLSLQENFNRVHGQVKEESIRELDEHINYFKSFFLNKFFVFASCSFR